MDPCSSNLGCSRPTRVSKKAARVLRDPLYNPLIEPGETEAQSRSVLPKVTSSEPLAPVRGPLSGRSELPSTAVGMDVCARTGASLTPAQPHGPRAPTLIPTVSVRWALRQQTPYQMRTPHPRRIRGQPQPSSGRGHLILGWGCVQVKLIESARIAQLCTWT